MKLVAHLGFCGNFGAHLRSLGFFSSKLGVLEKLAAFLANFSGALEKLCFGVFVNFTSCSTRHLYNRAEKLRHRYAVMINRPGVAGAVL